MNRHRERSGQLLRPVSRGESLLVAGDDGTLCRCDRACGNWTALKVGEEAVHALACADGDKHGDGMVPNIEQLCEKL